MTKNQKMKKNNTSQGLDGSQGGHLKKSNVVWDLSCNLIV